MNYTKGKLKTLKLLYHDYLVEDETGFVIAYFNVHNGEQKDNAQLFIASGDMYEALKEAQHLIVDWEYTLPSNRTAVLDDIQKALSKAEGKEI